MEKSSAEKPITKKSIIAKFFNELLGFLVAVFIILAMAILGIITVLLVSVALVPLAFALGFGFLAFILYGVLDSCF